MRVAEAGYDLHSITKILEFGARPGLEPRPDTLSQSCLYAGLEGTASAPKGISADAALERPCKIRILDALRAVCSSECCRRSGTTDGTSR